MVDDRVHLAYEQVLQASRDIRLSKYRLGIGLAYLRESKGWKNYDSTWRSFIGSPEIEPTEHEASKLMDCVEAYADHGPLTDVDFDRLHLTLPHLGHTDPQTAIDDAAALSMSDMKEKYPPAAKRTSSSSPKNCPSCGEPLERAPLQKAS